MNEIWGWVNAQLGNILGFLGLGAGFWFYWLSRKPKRFGWEVISKTQILSHNSRALPLKVVYNGQEVTSPNIVVLRLGNTGKAEILGRDFDGPIKIAFKASQLLSSSVSRKFDESITAEIVQDANRSVSFTPPLLNAGEWLELQFVTDGPLETPSVHARIAGQNGRAMDVDHARKKIWEPINWVAIGIALLAPLAPLLVFGKDAAPVGLIISFACLALFALGSVMSRRSPGWRTGSRRNTR